MNSTDVTGIILAAGKGTRMKSDLPKVLHEAGGKPLVAYPVELLSRIGAKRTIVVLGHGIDLVQKVLPEGVETVRQEPQLGTGHALMIAAPKLAGETGTAVILYGDMPLLRDATILKLLDAHRAEGNSATILTAVTDDRPSYGRIIRAADGSVVKIVEAKDCSPEEYKIREVNSGTYCFRMPELLAALELVSNDNAQKEYYLTDAIGIIRERGGRVGAVAMEDPDEILGINTVDELKSIDAIIRGTA